MCEASHSTSISTRQETGWIIGQLQCQDKKENARPCGEKTSKCPSHIGYVIHICKHFLSSLLQEKLLKLRTSTFH